MPFRANNEPVDGRDSAAGEEAPLPAEIAGVPPVRVEIQPGLESGYPKLRAEAQRAKFAHWSLVTCVDTGVMKPNCGCVPCQHELMRAHLTAAMLLKLGL